MNPINPKNPPVVTDKLAGLPPKVTDLSFDEIRQASNAFYSGRMLHWTGEILDEFRNGYKLNKWEIEAMELIIEQYNLQYKSPLANALKEDNK